MHVLVIEINHGWYITAISSYHFDIQNTREYKNLFRFTTISTNTRHIFIRNNCYGELQSSRSACKLLEYKFTVSTYTSYDIFLLNRVPLPWYLRANLLSAYFLPLNIIGRTRLITIITNDMQNKSTWDVKM